MILNQTLLRFSKLFIACLVFYFSAIPFINAQYEDVTECPFFSISSADTAGVAFALLSTDVEATVSGVIANVAVKQTYINEGDSTVDATYVFPMSSNAAIYGMTMMVNDKTIVAEIRRKEEAQTIFDNANDNGLTASLLEQDRPNVFQMSLANINPGDTLSISMVYTELLVPRNGVYQFVFPNIVGPRFTTGGESWVPLAAQQSIPLSETALNIDLKIKAGMPVDANCTSHSANFEYLGTTTQTTLSTNPGDDFIVDYSLRGNEIETGLLLYEGQDENFFLSMIQPPKPDVQYDSPQREYIFLMDVSGSMAGQPIEISKELIINLLNDLNSDDKFNIIFFAGSSSQLSAQSLEVTNENINMAIAMIDNIGAGGGTQLLPALQLALDMEGTEDYSRSFVILTDGFVTVEKEGFDLIRENLNEANFFSFGIGDNVNRYIIDGMAYVGEGEPFVVTEADDPNTIADTFKEYIESPVLTNIEVLFEGIDVYDVEPLTIPDVFAERPIIVYGKYHTPANGSITILGDYADGEIESSLDFSDYVVDTEENLALPYLWARKRIKLMSDYGIASNESDTISIEEEITQLGLKYSLVTEFTSFVAVDSSAVSTTSDTPPGNNDDGGLVETSYIPASDKNELIKIQGTIVQAGGVLQLKLENLRLLVQDDITLRLTTIDGKLIATHRINPSTVNRLITLPIAQLSSGMYFVSLFVEDDLMDAEKFIVE